jgi:anti-sigma B factor antagonist
MMDIRFAEQDGVTTLALTGRLDANSAPKLEEETQKIFATQKKVALVLDLAELEYLSSAGLRVLLSVLKTVNASGGSLRIRNSNEIVHDVFEMTGFLRILSLE